MGESAVKAYKTTDVPVSRSQAQIKHILSKYGADGFQVSEDWKERRIMIRFLFTVKDKQHTVYFNIPIPQAEEFGPSGRPAIRAGSLESGVLCYQEPHGGRGVWLRDIRTGIPCPFRAPGGGRSIGEVLIPRLGDLNLRLLK
jgi:hypothetical protein